MIKPRVWIGVAVLAYAASARAECPSTPDEKTCRPWSALLLPAVFGEVYAPHGVSSTYAGGGAEAVLMAWSDNSPAFGPSQGRLRFDIGLLDSTGSEPSLGTMVKYRFGTQVSFERNASRSWMIPAFAFDVGGMFTESTRTRWFADAGIALYLVHRRAFVVDVEGTYLIPFKDPSTLAGLQIRLGAGIALW